MITNPLTPEPSNATEKRIGSMGLNVGAKLGMYLFAKNTGASGGGLKKLNLNNMNLFEIEPIVIKPENTCNSCEHRQRWECNSKVFQYCGVRKSNRTENGLLKIKCKDAACLLYKKCAI